MVVVMVGCSEIVAEDYPRDIMTSLAFIST